MNMIIAPFNGVYLTCWGIAVALMIAIGLIFKNKSEKAKTIFLVSLCAFTIVVYFIYKALLVASPAYCADMLKSGTKDYGWFYELPIQLCNINMFLIPIGVLTKKRGIMGFSFFLAPLGATMALIFPEPAFIDKPILRLYVLGFYLTHYLIVIAGISIATLGFFRPKFKDFPSVFLTLICLSFVVHLVNLGLRYSGLCLKANYFFTMEPGGVSLLELFTKITKIPFLYMLPALLILAAYMGIISLVFFVVNKLSGKKSAEAQPSEEKETVKTAP